MSIAGFTNQDTNLNNNVPMIRFEALPSQMLSAFGCLSNGLSHLHGSQRTNRNIKPANILYVKELSKDRPAQFIWVDFGLAYHFGTMGSSETGTLSQLPQRYAAPEIMEASPAARKAARKAKAAAVAGLYTNEDTDQESEASSEHEMDDHTARPVRGRSSDIFSFGCVFLELLRTITDTKLPIDESESYTFSKNITKLQAWAEKQKDQLEPSSPLRTPFILAIKMIGHKPEERPSIENIVEHLAEAAAAKELFCTHCLQEIEKGKL